MSSLVFLVHTQDSDDDESEDDGFINLADDDDDEDLLTTLNVATAICNEEVCKSKFNRCKKKRWCGNLKQCLKNNIMEGGKNQCKKKQRGAGVSIRACRIGVLEKASWCIPG